MASLVKVMVPTAFSSGRWTTANDELASSGLESAGILYAPEGATSKSGLMVSPILTVTKVCSVGSRMKGFYVLHALEP